MRDAPEVVLTRALKRAPFAGALAIHITEHPAEGAQAVPACLQRDLQDRQLRIAKQRLRPLESTGKQVAMGRQAEGLFEASREVRFGNVTHTRETLDRPGLGRGGIHSVLCT
jgi:hypothetical protein